MKPFFGKVCSSLYISQIKTLFSFYLLISLSSEFFKSNLNNESLLDLPEAYYRSQENMSYPSLKYMIRNFVFLYIFFNILI
jgi:hypothetical protein